MPTVHVLCHLQPATAMASTAKKVGLAARGLLGVLCCTHLDRHIAPQGFRDIHSIAACSDVVKPKSGAMGREFVAEQSIDCYCGQQYSSLSYTAGLATMGPVHSTLGSDELKRTKALRRLGSLTS